MSTKTNKIRIKGDGNIIIQDAKDSTFHLHIDDKIGLQAFLQKANKELVQELWEKLKAHKSTAFDNCKNVVSGMMKARNIYIGDVTHNHFYGKGNETQLPKSLSAKIPTLTQSQIVGRKAELKDLQQRLFNHRQVLLVNGLGGIGKTTLAQVYVGEHWEDYQHILWVSQLSDSFQNDLVNTEGLLLHLGIQSAGKEVKDLFLEILSELKKVGKQPNLMVIDNAEANLAEVYDYLPKQPNWHILVTSRQEIRHFEVKELGFLSESEAVDLFFQHYQVGKISRAIALSIVQSVDLHTLTIEILAKTAQRRKSKIEDLLEAIQKDLKANVYVRHSADKIDRVTSYLNTIFRLNQLEKTEVHLLQQFCGLPSEFHSYDLLTELLATEDENFPDTLADLCTKGWLLQNMGNDQYKMHRIIKEVVLRQTPPTENKLQKLIKTVTLKLKINQSKDNPVDKFRWIVFGESILALTHDNQSDRIAALQNNLALVLQDFGDYSQAKALLKKTVVFTEQNFGKNHPNTARCYSNLAFILQALGDYNGAKTLLEKAISSAEKNFGENHPITVVRNSNLATVLQELGNYERAITLLRKAIHLDKKNFGENHPRTAGRYCNLATVFQDLGRYSEAKYLLEKAIFSMEQNFGRNHPTLSNYYSNLAVVLQSLGDYIGAKNLFQQVMLLDEFNFGAKHPKSIVNYSNLATVFMKLEEHEKAASLLEKAMIYAEKNLGENHITTITIYSNLGLTLKNLGYCTKAIDLLKKAIYFVEQTLGKKHPTTANCYSNLALVFSQLKYNEKAKLTFQKAKRILEQSLGENHPITGRVYSNLATIYFNLKEFDEAVELLEKAYNIHENHLGKTHPNTKVVKENLDNIRSHLSSS